MMLGTAAMRSIAEISHAFSRRGAYSVMNSAKPMARGMPTATATAATSIVPTSTAAMPTLSSSGCQLEVVKKLNP